MLERRIFWPLYLKCDLFKLLLSSSDISTYDLSTMSQLCHMLTIWWIPNSIVVVFKDYIVGLEKQFLIRTIPYWTKKNFYYQLLYCFFGCSIHFSMNDKPRKMHFLTNGIQMVIWQLLLNGSMDSKDLNRFGLRVINVIFLMCI